MHTLTQTVAHSPAPVPFRVKLSSQDSHDSVVVSSVEVTEGADKVAAPKSLEDILYAVEALDSKLMSQLNTFMWDVESTMCRWGEGRDVQVRGGEGCAGEVRGGMCRWGEGRDMQVR